uniref:histone-lysine N-methyltransferase ATX3 isoform X2 n=1 Tax=Erigeron canadensis TaxID=72917 RepID=UPI001CB8A280|nr:histone-lysine N-methyltransferase ATX3 isoform X2 [Erigeron canadensis]
MIKQTVRSKMPNIKRCELKEEAAAESEEFYYSYSDADCLPGSYYTNTIIYDNNNTQFLDFSTNNNGDNSWHWSNRYIDRESVSKKPKLLSSDNVDRCKKDLKGANGLQDFLAGDIVWAKCSNRYPAWPAIVIDPIHEAPKAVLNACVPGTVCVMFYGYSKKGQRDYAWVKDGMIFPFLECMESFQGQTQLYGCKPDDFRAAIEEAYENSYLNSSYVDKEEYPTTTDFFEVPVTFVSDQHYVSYNSYYNYKQEECSTEPDLFEVPVAIVSELHPESYHRKQSGYIKKEKQPCGGCGLLFRSKALKKVYGITYQQEALCEHCLKLRKSKQYCGICKKIWHHSDGGDWILCDGCNVWVHAECANISSKIFKDLEEMDYYCPECRGEVTVEQLVVDNLESDLRFTENINWSILPDKISVICTGMEGIYYPKFNLVECKCGSCGSRKLPPSDWERHTGSNANNWKTSIKVKGSMVTLEKTLSGHNVTNDMVASALPFDEKQLYSFLQEKYEPVYAKWTTERCAICRWDEDYDVNAIIICNRCQIAVHQECYGARDIHDFTSWVCRACETPEVKRECCLCPIKGGALKPTDIENLWVHVICAWFRPEVSFLSDEKMEPATGIFRIPPDSFEKTCVICKQVHGSCIQCCKCTTYFHAMCASRAGYCVELHSSEKDGVYNIRWTPYCAVHRTPADTGIVIRTSSEVFCAKSFLEKQNQKQSFRSSRLSLSTKLELSDPSMADNDEPEPLSAARCRIYKKSSTKNGAKEGIFHRLMRPIQHSIDAIDSLNSHKTCTLYTSSVLFTGSMLFTN